MDEHIKIVKDFYDNNPQLEWERIDNRTEFILTSRYLDRYIRPKDKVLDIGGGPGRYSFYLAKKGCDVTLFDLSDSNIEFAKEKAKSENLSINTYVGDACEIDKFIDGEFDHVLLMGPMYHLLKEEDRIKTINKSLNLLKPGGKIFISFLNMISGIIFAMRENPKILTDLNEEIYNNAFIEDKSFAGNAFTKAFFIRQNDVLPFMSQFPLEKLHLFGQEGITAPCEKNIMSQEEDCIEAWMDLCEKTCEREELLSYSEHLMYIGLKKL